jgi:hypothetical protein
MSPHNSPLTRQPTPTLLALFSAQTDILNL